MPKLPGRQLSSGRRSCSGEPIIRQVIPLPSPLIQGWIFINDEKDTVCARSLETLKMNGLADGVVEFNSGKAITDMYEMFDGPMENCVGYFNPASVCPLLLDLIGGLGKCCTSNLPSSLRRSKSRRNLPYRPIRPCRLPHL